MKRLWNVYVQLESMDTKPKMYVVNIVYIVGSLKIVYRPFYSIVTCFQVPRTIIKAFSSI